MLILLDESNLSEIVEVVLAVDPAVMRSLVDAVRLVANCRQVRTVTVVERALEQLQQEAYNALDAIRSQ